ncbi:MAG: potassium-transporting ATPase subunit KdpC [Armatimonadetes bacterium]|nr:potassium-transporting ATPase subunit KdpC [Armatimonadota bacterium]
MIRHLRPALVTVLILSALFGLVLPTAITGAALFLFPHQAGGSLVQLGGRVIGSGVIGQTFASPGYFHPRPSAAGAGYDPLASGGTNLGPTNAKLLRGRHRDHAGGAPDPGDFDGIGDLAASYRAENQLAATDLAPADAVTRSASGLDPHISPRNAILQAARIARARRVSVASVRDIIDQNTEGRQWGIFGQPRVNVLRANLALDGMGSGQATAHPTGTGR